MALKKHLAFKKKEIIRIIFLLFCLASIIVLAYLLIFKKTPEVKIMVNDDEFYPNEITIKAGTKVTWTSRGKNEHWPAADNHPTHTQYPEGGGCIGSKLDACKGLKDGESFSFIFNSPGKWTMHDHMHPSNTMTVNVEKNNQAFFSLIKTNSSSDSFALLTPEQNKKMSEMNKTNDPLELARIAKSVCEMKNPNFVNRTGLCYPQTMYYLAKSKDKRIAFLTLTQLQKIDLTTFNCHLVAHGIGWGIYENDPENWKNSIANMSPECSYGAIHGVIERRYSTTGKPLDENDMKTICGKNGSMGCYHAIGHIVIVQTKNNLTEGLKLCHVYSSKFQRYHCGNGLFMEHMIGTNLAEHGLVSVERSRSYPNYLNEFIKLCKDSDDEATHSCWTEIIHAAGMRDKNNKDNYINIFKICNMGQTTEARKDCRRHAFVEILPANNFDPVLARKACKVKFKDDPTFEEDCYNLLASITAINNPEIINKAINHCSSLKFEDSEGCFGKISSSLGLLASHDKSKIMKICDRIPESYKFVCNR